MRVDPVRKFVDLSRKDVDSATAHFARRQYDEALESHKLLADVARTLDCCLHCCYSGLAWPLARRYGSLYQVRSLLWACDVLQSKACSFVFSILSLVFSVMSLPGSAVTVGAKIRIAIPGALVAHVSF